MRYCRYCRQLGSCRQVVSLCAVHLQVLSIVRQIRRLPTGNIVYLQMPPRSLMSASTHIYSPRSNKMYHPHFIDAHQQDVSFCSKCIHFCSVRVTCNGDRLNHGLAWAVYGWNRSPWIEHDRRISEAAVINIFGRKDPTTIVQQFLVHVLVSSFVDGIYCCFICIWDILLFYLFVEASTGLFGLLTCVVGC